VKNIIRVGTAAAVSKKLKLRDIVLGMSACTDSNYFSQYGVDAYFAPTASYGLLSKADKECERRGINAAIGTLYSSDVFYDEAKRSQKLADMGILAVEMETAALYLNAARSGKNALSVCTISDCVFDDSSCDSLERERSFTLMAEIALSIA
jgi:purine-nucleoside phosphorylase